MSEKEKQKIHEKDNHPVSTPFPPVEAPPEPTLRDVCLKLQAYKQEVNHVIEAIKETGTQELNNSKSYLAGIALLGERVNHIEQAFIIVNSTLAQILTELQKQKGQKPSQTQQTTPQTNQQPQTGSGIEKTVNIPPKNTFPIPTEDQERLVIGHRSGVGTTVKFNAKVAKDTWDKTNTFLRALGMKWISDKDNKIYEWQPI